MTYNRNNRFFYKKKEEPEEKMSAETSGVSSDGISDNGRNERRNASTVYLLQQIFGTIPSQNAKNTAAKTQQTNVNAVGNASEAGITQNPFAGNNKSPFDYTSPSEQFRKILSDNNIDIPETTNDTMPVSSGKVNPIIEKTESEKELESALKQVYGREKTEDSNSKSYLPLYGTNAWNASNRGASTPSPFLNNVQNNQLNPSVDSMNLSSQKNASEMTKEELLSKLLNDYMTPQSYSGLNDNEKNAIIDNLRRQASNTEEDVMGKYASMTGGVPSTAAVAQAAQAGSDVMSQLQDIISQQDNVKYNRWRDKQSDAYNRLNAFLGANGTSYTSKNSTGSTASENKTENVGDVTSQIMQETGEDGHNFGDYENFFENYSINNGDPVSEWPDKYNSIREQANQMAQLSSLLGSNMTADEYLNNLIPSEIMKDLAENYPDDFVWRMASIIDYLYSSGAITGKEKEQWIENSGLLDTIMQYKNQNQ